MFIVSLTFMKPLEEIEKQLMAHRAFLKENYDKGIFIFSGRKVPPTGGIILAHRISRAELETLLAQDPFSTHGIAGYEITEFTPTMAAEELKDFMA